jgi:hypothetical protein
MLVFKHTESLGKFNRGLLCDLLRPITLRLPHLYIILSLYKTSLNCPNLAKFGYYNDSHNLYTNLRKLEKLGYLYQSSGLWGLAGKGEVLYYSFIEYAKRAGVWVEDSAE